MVATAVRLKNGLIILFLTCLFAVAGKHAGMAADYFVDITSGVDASGGGASAAPWKTLHYAVPRLTSSDILHVVPGFYTIANGEADELLEIFASGVTIQADGPGVVIEGSGASYWVDGLKVGTATNVRISGLHFLYFGNTAITFQNLTGLCLLSDCTFNGNATGIRIENSNPTITRNRLFDNGYSITVIADSTAGQASPEIWNNLIASPEGAMQYGIKIEATATGAVASPAIFHNTIDGGSADGIYIYNLGATVSPDIRFNIVTNFSQYGVNNIDGTPSHLDYNDIWNNSGGNYMGATADINNISRDPSYLPDGEKDYLQSTSPCINGIPTAGHPVGEDLLGTLRPQGSRVDMGCFEIVEPFILPGTYYVDVVNGRNDPTAGRSPGTAAFRNLHYALKRFNFGDPGQYFLQVAPGTYSIAGGEEDDWLEVGNGGLTVQGTEPLRAVIDGSGATHWNDGMKLKTSGITITGLLFQHFRQSGVAVENSSPTIHRNEFVNNHVGITVNSYKTAAAPVIINNLFRGDATSGMASGILLKAMDSAGSAGGNLYFNTMDGGSEIGIAITNSGGIAAPEIKYNIISNFGMYGIYNSAGNPTLAYNNLYQNVIANYLDISPGTTDISVSPLYGGPADYHLQGGSPCIDGIPANIAFPAALLPYIGQDLDGNPRPIPSGGGYDMGAYEQSSSTLTLSLTISPEGGGSVTDNLTQINCPGDCSGNYSATDTIVLQAFADAGYRFDHWEEGTNTHTENPMTFAPHENQTVRVVFTALDNQPPNTPAGVSPQDGARFDGSTAEVALLAGDYSDPENDSHAQTYWLVRRQDRGVYYCDDYDASFTQTDNAPPGLTIHTVSGFEPGMQYVWKVGYQDAGSGRISWSPEYTFTIGDVAVDRDVNIPAGIRQLDYRMVSFPVWPSNPDCPSAFRDSFPDGLYDTRNIRLGTYDPVQGRYLECHDNLVIKPGRAYWLLSREGVEVVMGGIPTTRKLDLEVSLTYDENTGDGWNMVACPNFAAYEWANVEILESDGAGGVLFDPAPIGSFAADNPYIDIRLWRWEDGAYADDTIFMRPHMGYWVKVRKANLFLKFPETAQLSATGVFSAATRTGMNETQTSRQTDDDDDDDDDDSPPPPMGANFTIKSNGVSAKGACFLDNLIWKP